MTRYVLRWGEANDDTTPYSLVLSDAMEDWSRVEQSRGGVAENWGTRVSEYSVVRYALVVLYGTV